MKIPIHDKSISSNHTSQADFYRSITSTPMKLNSPMYNTNASTTTIINRTLIKPKGDKLDNISSLQKTTNTVKKQTKKGNNTSTTGAGKHKPTQSLRSILE